jgi:imidazoleglycerol-phosphate dehydratase
MANKSQLKAPRLKVASAAKPRTRTSANGEALAARSAAVERKTRETEVKVVLDLDGGGRGAVETGVPFLDHMLESFARHGFFDLVVQASGDLHIDEHHTVEDVGIVLGRAFRQALGDRAGIRRFGEAMVPLDEALCSAVVDISGRSYLAYNVPIGGRNPHHVIEAAFKALARAMDQATAREPRSGGGVLSTKGTLS